MGQKARRRWGGEEPMCYATLAKLLAKLLKLQDSAAKVAEVMRSQVPPKILEDEQQWIATRQDAVRGPDGAAQVIIGGIAAWTKEVLAECKRGCVSEAYIPELPLELFSNARYSGSPFRFVIP